MRRMTVILAATVIGVGLAGGAVLAQGQGSGPGPGYGMMGPGMMGGWSYDQGWFDSAKTKVGIRADQEKPWDAYVDAVRNTFQSMQDMHNGMDFDAISKMTLDERRQFMLGIRESRIQQMNAVFDARNALFKTLDPDQRRTAATLLTPGAYGRGMGMGMGMGPGAMMGGGARP